jgi:hypothetical protein
VAIVESLRRKGTPAGNYKVSEVDEDIILDTDPLVIHEKA